MTVNKPDHVFANARIVLADRVIEQGWLAIADGVIAEFGEGGPPERGEDFERRPADAGPGRTPYRSSRSALRTASQGALEPGRRRGVIRRPARHQRHHHGARFASGLDARRAPKRSTARRRRWPVRSRRRGTRDCCGWTTFCICAAKCRCRAWSTRQPQLMGRSDVRLVSLMDHTPGQRQFRDEGKLRDYYRGKKGGLTDFAARRVVSQAPGISGDPRQPETIAGSSIWRAPTTRRSQAMTTPRSDMSRTPSATVSRSRSFRPPSRPPKPFTPEAFAC